jgi:coenzyme Q-binding protein COQ10
MAQAAHEALYDVDASQLYQAVTDYEKYPEFVEGMKKVTVERNGDSVVAHYELSMMGKDMSYSLQLKEEPETGHLSWTLLKSEFFKINNGDWLIQSNGSGKCKARYASEVEFTFPVPSFMLKPMVKGALPKMMDGFYERAKKFPKIEVKAEVKEEKIEVKPAPVVEEPKIEQPKYRQENMNENTQTDSGVLSWAKKIMTVGVGTFFLTEESLRSMVSEFKLPKELVGTLLEGAKGVRKEFMQNVVNEMMSKISDKMNPSDVLAEFLRKNEVTFEIKLKVKEKTDTDL